MHLAVMMKHAEMVKILLEFGASVKLKNENEQDATELAEFEGNSTIRYLLKSLSR